MICCSGNADFVFAALLVRKEERQKYAYGVDCAIINSLNHLVPLWLQVQAFFEFYPKRVGQVLFVEAPWVFGPAWEVIRPLMRKYAALVSVGMGMCG